MGSRFFAALLLISAIQAFAAPAQTPAKKPAKEGEEAPQSFPNPVLFRMPATKEAGEENSTAEFQELGEGVFYGINRLVKKKSFDLFGDPWTIQGLPILFPNKVNGFTVGMRLKLQNIRRQDPHKMEVDGQVMATDNGKFKHLLKIDVPRAFDGRFRLITELRYDRDLDQRFFGIGNNTKVDRALVDANSVLYQNIRQSPSVSFTMLRRLSRHFHVGPRIGFKWTGIEAPTGSLLLTQNPAGIGGGRTHFLGFAVIYDGLDFEPYPSRGAWHELFFNAYTPWLGSEYEFYRSTYTYRQYYRLHRTLILTHRILFEMLNGNIPYFELGATGGYDPTLGSGGGDRYLRGYEQNQFVDRFKFAFGLELRWDPVKFNWAKQQFMLGLVPFVDAGRVWRDFFPVDLGHFHGSIGWGARLIWNYRFVLRGDYAMTIQGSRFFIEIGNTF